VKGEAGISRRTLYDFWPGTFNKQGEPQPGRLQMGPPPVVWDEDVAAWCDVTVNDAYVLIGGGHRELLVLTDWLIGVVAVLCEAGFSLFLSLFLPFFFFSMSSSFLILVLLLRRYRFPLYNAR
jgi:hypothetical protein